MSYKRLMLIIMCCIAGEQGGLIGLINSGVHVIMYSYYFLASFGPDVQKYLWWKKYITRLQLVSIVFLHMTRKILYLNKINKAKWKLYNLICLKRFIRSNQSVSYTHLDVYKRQTLPYRMPEKWECHAPACG